MRSLIIGITGGIATGKSTVTKVLSDKGYPVICADTIAHNIVNDTRSGRHRGRPLQKIIKIFGQDILLNNQSLNRKKLAQIIFNNTSARKKLEKIIHPAVIQETKKQIMALKKKKHRLIFLDVPLLFESGMDKICDVTICVSAPQKIQMARMIQQRKMTRKDALSRIKAQMPLTEKINKSSYVIRNISTKSALIKKVERVLLKLP